MSRFGPPPGPTPVVASAHADAVLVMHQVKALAHQIMLRPDLASERAEMILEALEGYISSGSRMAGQRTPLAALNAARTS